jgi:hypothetical protein
VSRAAGRIAAHAGRLRRGSPLLLLSLACATAAPPPPPPPAPPATVVEVTHSVAAVKLIWLPAEAPGQRALADAVNRQLEAARLPGVTAHQRGAVSMDVAQLSLDCSEPTDECYRAVGRHLQANRLMWVRIAGGSRRKKAVTVTLFLFDVDRGAMASTRQRAFPGAEAARTGLEDLLAAPDAQAQAAASEVRPGRSPP